MTPIEIALVLLLLHGALGAFDTFYNHEWQARLPHRTNAGPELQLHGLRSALFVMIFAGLAWLEWRGAWAWVPLLLIAAEYGVTLADAVVEDATRRLSPVERINHQLLGLNTGLYAAFVAIQVVGTWRHHDTALLPTHHPVLSELLTVCAVAVAVWAIRDALAAQRLAQALPQS